MELGKPYGDHGKWYFRCGDSKRGPYQTETVAKREYTRAFNRANKLAIAAQTNPDLPPGEPPPLTLQWWTWALYALGQRLLRGGSADDRQDMRAIAQGAQAAKQVWDITEIEKERDDLRAVVAEILGAQKHATRTEGRVSATEAVARPTKPLH